MDSNIRKSLENNFQMIDIKPVIDELKSTPNDTTKITPLIKYIKNLKPIHYSLANEDFQVLKEINPILEIPEEPKIKNTVFDRYFGNNRLTINNNTNLTNLNLYFLYNTESNEPSERKVNPRNSEMPFKKKEPTDTVKKNKQISNKTLNYNDLEDINKTQRSKRYSSTNYRFTKGNSISSKNNDTSFGKEKREIVITNNKKADNTKKKFEKTNKIIINLKKIDESNNNNIARKETPKDQKKINSSNNIDKIKIKDEPKGDLNLSEFIKLNQIGKGTFGKIFAVKWNKNGKKYALKKETFTDPEFLEKRKGIVKIINDFLHKTKTKGVIKIFSSLFEKNKKEYNYYELMEIGDRDWEQEINLRRNKGLYYSEKELFNIAKQLIKTLSLLQKNHITHRDIKHQNILIINGTYKLCDFGEIRVMKGNGLVVQRIRGSELFMSPILFYGLRANLIQVKHNTYKSDVFSLGMCLLYAATMYFDVTDEIREMIDMKKIRITLEKYLKKRYSNEFISLLCSMLETNEDLRPDFEHLEKKINNFIVV
jgi:hypothetical protein